MISPHQCQHRRRVFVTSYRSAPLGDRHDIDICEDCGRFHVWAQQGEEFVSLEFELVSEEQIQAASQYARYLKSQEVSSEYTM